MKQAFDLHKLDGGNPARRRKSCKICGSAAWEFDLVDFLKTVDERNIYPFGFSGVVVTYFRCESCEFMFTDFCDDWSANEFAAFIYNEDYAKVDPDYLGKRPLAMATQMAAALEPAKNMRILDYGSGGGHFENRMRTLGFGKLESYDPFSHPQRPQGKFDIITAFEVLEHAPDPHKVLLDMTGLLAEGGLILCTTALQPEGIEQIRGNWPYAAPRNGHISLFSSTAMLRLAGRHGFSYCEGNGLHGFLLPGAADLRDLAVRVTGPFVQMFSLLAPNENASAAWGAPEPYTAGHFRWTRGPEIEWQIEIADTFPSNIRLFVPVIMEIEPGFGAGSSIFLDGAQLYTRRAASGIRAELALEGPVSGRGVRVLLRTPPLKSPAQLRGAADDRELGLAVPIPRND
jgi:SAM-dependent methyltransferase